LNIPPKREEDRKVCFKKNSLFFCSEPPVWSKGDRKKERRFSMSKNIRKAILIDALTYFFADQAHLLDKLRSAFGTSPIYFVVNPENSTWEKVGQKLLKVWEKYNAKVKLSRDVDMDLVEEVVKENKAQKIVVGSNNETLLWRLAETAIAKPIYLRIIYKTRNGEWTKPPYVLEELRRYGYTVIDWRVANRIEGALARMLMIGFDEVLNLWEQRERFRRNWMLARERVLPKIDKEITLQGFNALCEKENILYPLETVYFLAIFGYINIQSKNGIVVISPVKQNQKEKIQKERKSMKDEEIVEGQE
jgi:hypothetical protein